MKSLLVVCATLALCVVGCKKDTPAPATGTTAGAATAPAVPAPGGPGAAAPGVPGQPGMPPDFAARAAERRAEITKLIAELPAETPGADTPEAAARAFAAAVAKGDQAALKNVLVSTKDLESFLPADKLERAKLGVAGVLFKIKRALSKPMDVVGFEVGQTEVIKAGQKGFKTDVTLVSKSRLVANIDGSKRKLRFKSIIKIGDKWKISEL